jgi:DNA-binding response OmpR family regulator
MADVFKALVVEDDEVLVKMYKKKFEAMGWAVEIARNGKDGLVKIKSFRPNVVLMDIMMPEMDGMTALQAAKGDPDIKHIPIIMLTNLSTADDAVEAMKSGALDYMVKSDYTPSQVAEKVRDILARKT